MAHFRRKSETIEAWQFNQAEGAPDWVLEARRADMITRQAGGWYVMAIDYGSLVQIEEGDWIVYGGDGRLTPVKQGLFESQYEAVS